jgi:hypothetical protein
MGGLQTFAMRANLPESNDLGFSTHEAVATFAQTAIPLPPGRSRITAVI